jgi:uridine kinase
LHDESGWEDIASIFDLAIFLNSDIDACIERVKVRNKCIPGYTPEGIEIRCENVDRVNALTVMKSKARANIVVEPFATTHNAEIHIERKGKLKCETTTRVADFR